VRKSHSPPSEKRGGEISHSFNKGEEKFRKRRRKEFSTSEDIPHPSWEKKKEAIQQSEGGKRKKEKVLLALEGGGGSSLSD